jgi:hypothetical protein
VEINKNEERDRRPDRPFVLETNLTTPYLLKKLDEVQTVTPQSVSIAGTQ